MLTETGKDDGGDRLAARLHRRTEARTPDIRPVLKSRTHVCRCLAWMPLRRPACWLALVALLVAGLVSARPAHAIVGGYAAGTGSYPWQVAVLAQPDGEDAW